MHIEEQIESSHPNSKQTFTKFPIATLQTHTGFEYVVCAHWKSDDLFFLCEI